MFSENKSFDRSILLLVLAVIVVEALLFFSFYTREIAWYPPLKWDQSVYLTETYRLQEKIFANGLSELWHAMWSAGHPSGLLLAIEGALSGLLLGGTRWPQLFVNFIAFVALQAIAFKTGQAVWSRRAYGYAALGLILCQATLWLPIGGLFDFRMDFLAYCLYGVWTCAVIRSNLFLDRRWAIACGLISAFLVLNRFLTISYVLGVCAGFIAVSTAISIFQPGKTALARRMWTRLCNTGLSLGILTIIVVPILVLNWTAIHDYYVIGHALGDEKYVRAREAGITDLAGYLLYYPKTILFYHWGPTFLWGSAIVMIGGLAARLLCRRNLLESEQVPGRDETFFLQIIFLIGAILGPVVALTIDIAKSSTVGGVVGVPTALLVVALAARIRAGLRETNSRHTGKLVAISSLAVFALGLFHYFDQASRHVPDHAHQHDLERLAELDGWLVNYAVEQGWSRPKISFDLISDQLNTTIITASGYEQLHKFVEFSPMLGNGIMGVEKSEALSLLENSDFIILTDAQKEGPYPFYNRVARYWGDLKAWSDKNMFVARTVRFDKFTVIVYARPTAKISGIMGGWVSIDGFAVEPSRTALHQFPVIRLRGPANYSWLPKIPTVSAAIETGKGALAVPASLQRTDDGYEIRIDTSAIELPPIDPVRVQLTFDTFFIPKEIGINDDTRKLVIPAPTFVQLIGSKS